MTVISRAYQTEADYSALRRFLMELPDVPNSHVNVATGDLDWWRYSHQDVDRMLTVQLWIDDSRNAVVGFAWPEAEAIDIFVDPRFRQLEPEMINWAIAHSQANGDASLTIVANDRDRDRQIALTKCGFESTDAHYTYRGRSLETEIPNPAIAEGYRFGDLVGADDACIQARVDVHRAAWDPSKYTVEKQRRVMASPTYRPDLDLVVIGPGEAFATCTIVWYDAQNQFGVFEPVGAHPDHRRLGLTAAMMYEGMRRLRALGARRVYVNSWHASIPANKLYESCGFQLVDHQRKWTLKF
jgi:GNAT superfamily N-acetyltransferase